MITGVIPTQKVSPFNTDANCVFEKKKWISITGLCNDNCRFCLDKDRPDMYHHSIKEIKKEIKKSKDNGATKLILSGGEPTIHPNIIEFVRYAKKLNYNKIQVITNGRMFSKKEWADKILDAGLTEVTFSVHGYDSKTHDEATRTTGSFKQIVKGIINIRANKRNTIINTDTVITKLSYKYLPNTIKTIVEILGIREINLMSIVPWGFAWINRKEIMYNYEDVAPYVHKVLDYCIKNNVTVWLSRFPGQYLEGYEQFIESPYKLVDDINGAGENVYRGRETPPCFGERCDYCAINPICKDIVTINNMNNLQIKSKKSNFIKPSKLTQISGYIMPENANSIPLKQADFTKDKKILKKFKVVEITKENYVKLPDEKGIIIKYPDPERKLKDSRKKFVSFTNLSPYLSKLKKSKFKDIPPCIVAKEKIVKNVPKIKEEYFVDGVLNYVSIAQDLTLRTKMKRVSCKTCKYNDECEGVYRDYFRTFGFKEINPIKLGD